MHVNGNQANDKISIKTNQRPKSLHVNQTRWAKISAFKKPLRWRYKLYLRITTSDKLDFRVNRETTSIFLTWTEVDGEKRCDISLFTATLIHISLQWHNCADGLLSFIPAVEGRTRHRAGPVLMWRRCPFTANWLLCAHHLVISSDWLMVKPPLVIQVSQACVPVIKICHPEPHPSSPLNPSVRWQSSDNAPNSYFSDRTIAHLCQTENKRSTFLQDYVKLVC